MKSYDENQAAAELLITGRTLAKYRRRGMITSTTYPAAEGRGRGKITYTDEDLDRFRRACAAGSLKPRKRRSTKRGVK